MSTHDKSPPLALTDEEREAVRLGIAMIDGRALTSAHYGGQDDEAISAADTLRALLARAAAPEGNDAE